MNRNDIKIKYLIGLYKDDPHYPTIEDFEFLIVNWINDGGNLYNKTVIDIGEPCFPYSILLDKLDGNEALCNQLINKLQNEGRIELLKETKVSKYYAIKKTDYYQLT